MSNSKTTNYSKIKNEAEDIVKILEKENKLKYYRKNVILILGNTDSGKDEFTRCIINNNKTEENTSDSNTIYPNLIEDLENNVTFCDCPAFSDSEVLDIIGTYFIEKVIDSARSIKLIFTVNYSSIRNSVTKEDCWSLVKDPVKLIADFKEFHLNMALVVTYIDSELKVMRNNSKYVYKDNMIVNDIAEILKTCRIEINKLQEYKSKVIPEHQRKEAVYFIDNLIVIDENNKYTRIGIFRRYNNHSRSLSDIVLFNTNRNSLKEMLHNNLKFNSHKSTELRYNRLYHSTEDVHDLIADLSMKINRKISLDIEIMTRKIEKYFVTQEKELNNVENLYQRFILSYTTFASTQTSIAECLETECLTKKIVQDVNNLNITTSYGDFKNVHNFGMFLKFISSYTENNVIKPIEWSKGLTNLVRYLHISSNWYYLLKLLDVTLGNYKIQKYIESNRDRITNLVYQNLAKIRISEEYVIEYSNIGSMLKVLNNIFVNSATLFCKGFKRVHDDIKNVTLNTWKVKFLITIVDQAIVSRTNTFCDGSKLVVKGNYPILSNIEHCANCSQFKFIEILALKKFYIDTNLTRAEDELIQLFVIAPELVVVGDPTIFASEDDYSLSALPSSKCSKTNIRKQSELISKQGGPAGDFVTISRKVVRRNHLDIKYENENNGITSHAMPYCINNEMRLKVLAPDGDSFFNKSCRSELEYPLGMHHVIEGTCVLYDSICVNSYRGFNRTGYIMFITEETQSNLEINDATINYLKGRKEILPDKACRRQKEMTYKWCSEIRFKRLQNEQKDSYSYLYLRAFDMKQGATTIFDILPNVINDYKKYAWINLINSINEPSLAEFLVEIDRHDLYTTLDFVNELQNLEERFYELKNNIPLLPLYQSLLNRVKRYELKLQDNQELTDNDRSVLTYLRTAILSKICIVKYKVESDFSRNLPKYLDEAIHDVYKVKNLRESSMKYNYNIQFREHLKKKIDETIYLITNKMSPEVDEIFPRLKSKIDLLFLEVKHTLIEVNDEKLRLYSAKKDVTVRMTVGCSFTLLKTGSLLLFLLGPAGILSGIITETFYSVSEYVVLHNIKTSQVKNVRVPVGVINSFKKIREEYEKEKMLYKQQLKKAKTDLENYLNEDASAELKQFRNKISRDINNLDEEENNNTSLDSGSVSLWATYKTEMTDMMGLLKTKLAAKPVTIINQKRLRMLSHVEVGLTIGTEIADVNFEINHDVSQSASINKAIQMSNMKTELLKDYAKIIKEIIIPKSGKAEKIVKNTIKILPGLSKTSLEIVAWKIQNILKDAKTEMKQMTEGFDVEDDIIFLIEKLQDSLAAIIEMYKHIQEYRETNLLADYIANINLGKPQETVITDSELDSMLKNLKLIIQSNLILGKYQNSINAFKHEVFPLASYYLADFDLPPIHKASELNDSVSDVVRVIEELKLMLDKYLTGINSYSTEKHINVTFGCGSRYVPPFFVWKFDKYKYDIQKLLLGEEVILKSDVRQGVNVSAIKFNVIRIRFSLANKLIQNKFDAELTNFKIKMKHFGTSYYRCDDKFYKITNMASDVITYIFNKNCEERPELPNVIYDDLAKYHPVLSPYATWGIQITRYVDGGFDELSKYANEEMDLLLEGIGEYLDLGIEGLCNDDLGKYYAEDDGALETNFVDIGTGANLYKAKNGTFHNKSTIRTTRDVDQNDENTIATNGECNNEKSSFINNFFNLIGNTLMVLKHWIPTSEWLIDYKDIIFEERHIINIDLRTDLQALNSQYLQKLLPKLTESADNESQTFENNLNTYLFFSNANLLFLNSVIHWKNGMKYKQRYSAFSSDLIDVPYAQHLAYKAHAHDDI